MILDINQKKDTSHKDSSILGEAEDKLKILRRKVIYLSQLKVYTKTDARWKSSQRETESKCTQRIMH